jgi:hypothetical protein
MSKAKPLEVEVIKVNATKLDPNATHIIAFREGTISYEGLDGLSLALSKRNIDAVIVLTRGQPDEEMKVYQIANKEIVSNGKKTN